jgi:hypothetical protein
MVCGKLSGGKSDFALYALEKRTSAASKQAAEKLVSLKGTAFRPYPRVSTFLELRKGDYF